MGGETPGQSPITIQEAGVGDLGAIRALEAVCFPEDQYGWGDMFFLLTVGDLVRLKAVAGRELVGFVVGEPHPERGMAWIVTLGVLPGYQRRGIAARLLAECECRLTLKKIPRSRLRVRASNVPAIALYRRAGYQSVGYERDYYPGPEDALVMEKRLLT